VKSSDLGLKLMKYWLKQPVIAQKVGQFLKRFSLTDPATWNPGKKW
jgi:hypothetical protein